MMDSLLTVRFCLNIQRIASLTEFSNCIEIYVLDFDYYIYGHLWTKTILSEKCFPKTWTASSEAE